MKEELENEIKLTLNQLNDYILSASKAYNMDRYSTFLRMKIDLLRTWSLSENNIILHNGEKGTYFR
jgi:hypothetical protein